MKSAVSSLQPHPAPEIPSSPSEFYRQLTTRNRHFIAAPVQAKLRSLKILIAGCGAAGGACIEPLARVGVTHFRLADSGDYELSNLNRQHTFVDQLGRNKAAFHADEIKRINPHVDVIAFTEGVTRENLPELVEWADLIVDAVDVTTQNAIQLKFLLHELACKRGKPVFSPLDPGFCQLGYGFDYRERNSRPLHGRLDACRKTLNPIHGLMAMFPVGVWPAHSLELIADLLENPTEPASQLGASADTLAGIIVAAVVRFAETGTLIRGWHTDLGRIAYSPGARLRTWFRSFALRAQIRRLLSKGSR